MKSIRTNPANHAEEGDERIRTAEQALGADSAYVPWGYCLNCGHHSDHHVLPGDRCDTELRDYGEMDCRCPGLRLCGACMGDPEAHGLHVCGRES